VLSVQPRRGREGDEELRPVGVGSGVRHAQHAGARVSQLGRDLVGELLAVDGGPAAAGARRVPALDHERGDDAVEDHAVVVPPGRERAEVLAGLRRVGVVELDGYRPLGRDIYVSCDVLEEGGGVTRMERTIEVSSATLVAIFGSYEILELNWILKELVLY
jgi:hypothetical protein